MATNVYVDAFNLYYGCLKGTPYRWLDLGTLCVRDRLVVLRNQIPRRQRFPGRHAHHVREGRRGEGLLHRVHHSCPDGIDVGREVIDEVVF